MNDLQYRQYCSLQEQIRSAGFPQDFDEKLKTGVMVGAPHFGVACRRWGNTSDDRVYYQLNFYKLDGEEDFSFDHFQVTYRKPMVIPCVKVNGVDLSELESRMRMIDWNYLVQQTDARDVFIASQQQIRDIIMGIVDDLDLISKTSEGQKLRDLIEAKYLSDTHPVKHTELQAVYEQINKPYEVELLVPVRGQMPVNLNVLDDAIYNNLPLPDALSHKHQIYRVDTVGHGRQADGALSFIPFLERNYFSSLQTAVDFIQRAGDESFQPYHVLRNSHLRACHEMIIMDELTNERIAAKYGLWAPNSVRDLSANIIQWRLEDNMISPEQFERKSGLQISLLGRPDGERGVFQQFPPIAVSPALRSKEDLFHERAVPNQNKKKGRHL